jgi:hypothetical protein
LLLLLKLEMLLLLLLLLLVLLLLNCQPRVLFMLACALQLRLGCVAHACNSRCTNRRRLLAELLQFFCSVRSLMLRCFNCHTCHLMLSEASSGEAAESRSAGSASHPVLRCIDSGNSDCKV